MEAKISKKILEVDFKEKLINESVQDLKDKSISTIYCFSEEQANNIVNKYGKPCIVKKISHNTWKIEKTRFE